MKPIRFKCLEVLGWLIEADCLYNCALMCCWPLGPPRCNDTFYSTLKSSERARQYQAGGRVCGSFKNRQANMGTRFGRLSVVTDAVCRSLNFTSTVLCWPSRCSVLRGGFGNSFVYGFLQVFFLRSECQFLLVLSSIFLATLDRSFTLRCARIISQFLDFPSPR